MQYIKDQVYEQTTAVRALLKKPRLAAFSVLNLCMVVFSALMLWKGLNVIANSDAPIVVVLSGSMEPAFQRGDILFLSNNEKDVSTGEIIVFKISGREIPIVHRVIQSHSVVNGTQYSNVLYDDTNLQVLTKGDNNHVDDKALYAPGQNWLARNEMAGSVTAALRGAGMVTIYLNDYPALKYVILGLMAVFVLTTREG